MAPNLSDMPDEVLGVILGNFCLHCTREHDYDGPEGYFRSSKRGEQDPDCPSWYSHDYSPALQSMCLVSRRFLSIAQPLLHHAFLPGYGDSWRSTVFSWDRRLSAFLRTIVRRPDLAASVKRIYVHPNLLCQIKPEEANSALDDAARVLVNLDVAEYTAHFEAMLAGAGSLYTDGLRLLGVVLTLFPNLDRLSLQVTGPTGGIPAQAFQTLASAISPGQRPQSRLKTLDICSQSEGQKLFDLDHHASGILEVAGYNLETLNIHMCGAAGLRIEEDRLRLRHLRITQSWLGDVSLGKILSACAPGLETFVFEASYPSTESLQCVFVWPDGVDRRQPTDLLLRHLVKFRATLKSLHFDLRSRSNPPGGYTIPLTGTDTLTSFEALENVFISASSICSPEEPINADTELLTNLLPPNMRTLNLAGDTLVAATNRLAKALVHLAKTAAQGRGRFGALERVRCDTSMAQVVDEMAVPELFAAAGIDFGYESWSLSEATVPKGALSMWDRVNDGYAHWPSVPMPLPPDNDSDPDL
ncbi:hypothetical protein VP1G_05508 [Cytospora mali]|uniref:F-box domain-containing protein n=1 Tax=Cytospora mali TaxID=578113 RepID=A0A194V2P0_CYTMA|nr:hypothetical protein VP1G_05508 [Valsa mali var. pyri (nom. inval.)]